MKGFSSLKEAKNVLAEVSKPNLLWSTKNCMNYHVISFLSYFSQITNITIILLEPTASNFESDSEDVWTMKKTIFNEKLNSIILHIVKYNSSYYYYRKV